MPGNTWASQLKNAQELNGISSCHPPGRPPFRHEQAAVVGDGFDTYHRGILVLAPGLHCAGAACLGRLFHGMRICKWRRMQPAIEREKPGATTIPIAPTEKTQLARSRDKEAHPVYVTIGSVPREICRKPLVCAGILLAWGAPKEAYSRSWRTLKENVTRSIEPCSRSSIANRSSSSIAPGML
ncbi:hypothetical protein BC834DRAFT_975140 [Gloeopeniophorella convolvens]|nr:hypothetical protein BC834DRAFT_975140 [Gloeopeniophorella convolvens]